MKASTNINDVLMARMLTGFVAPKSDSAPLGSAYPITDEWRAKVRARLDELKMSQAELARRVGCTPAAITNVLRDNKQTSLLPKIHRVLGWDDAPLPETAVTAPSNEKVAAEFAAIAKALPPEVRDGALTFLRTLLDQKRRR